MPTQAKNSCRFFRKACKGNETIIWICFLMDNILLRGHIGLLEFLASEGDDLGPETSDNPILTVLPFDM